MLKTELTIETVGKPDITAMTESEQTSFLDSLYESIVETYKESQKQQSWKHVAKQLNIWTVSLR